MTAQAQRGSDERMAKVMGTDESSRRARRRKRLLIGAAIVAAVVLIVFVWLQIRGGGDGLEYVTAEVVRGDLTVMVSATGNLAPLNQVDVGSEVSGLVEEVLVEENDRVEQGQVLARLDLSRLNDEVAKARANLAAAEARLAQAQATVAEAEANIERLRRVYELSEGKVPAKAEIDAAEAALERARAEEASARAAVANARATLSVSLTNIEKATIASPVDGVVLDRKVEPGQTIQAAFTAPVLFTIAQDLSRMKLEVDVDEADIGAIREGQPAVFTVDAYPGRTFRATVRSVRLGATTVEGIVSYEAVLTFDNEDLLLRPGMTANAEIITVTREDVLLVPAAAFRWSPPAGDDGAGRRGGFAGGLIPRRPRQDAPGGLGTTGSERTLWVLRDGEPVEVEVTVGATNGRLTEITSGNLEAGDQVITETAVSEQ